MSAKKRLTIDDIATVAGVSKTTVSRYINGRSELMSDKTRERIKAVIEMTNYTPSDIASNLKKRTTNLIGLLIADISSPFSSALIIGISEYLEERGYTLLIANTADDSEKEERALKSLLAKGVSGFLVNTASYTNVFMIQSHCTGVPIVLCDRYVRNHNFDIVTLNHREGLFALVNHLKEFGYTRPLFFTQEWENNSTRIKRREYFIEAVRQIYGYDATEDVYTIYPKGYSVQTQLNHIINNKKSEDIPAVIGSNSITTVRLFHAITELGLSIPEEIGLCGPEDWDWSNELNWPFIIRPNVTTLKIPSTLLGRNAAKLLLEKMEKPDSTPQEIFLPCTLNIRGSTLHSTKNNP